MKKLRYVLFPFLFSIIAAIPAWFFVVPTAQKELATWKSIWIKGAPLYHYIEGAKVEVDEETFIYPALGSQYGELRFLESEIQSPLYYGDTETCLDKGLGIYAGGAIPGAAGISLISGHDTTYMSGVEEVKEGEQIRVSTLNGEFYYQVRKIEVKDVMVLNQELDFQSTQEELVLYTCYPFEETEQERTERYVIYADRISEEEVGE